MIRNDKNVYKVKNQGPEAKARKQWLFIAASVIVLKNM